MGCVGCGRGFHRECENDKGCSYCHPDYDQVAKSISSGFSIGKGAPLKDSKNISDPYSTGRKRAAKMYPIFETNPCEWRGKKNCGGGLFPITGCIDGKQVDRHHGPVKNTLRNEPGNVHRICKNCHNRWHALNDPEYNDLVYENLKHEPELATDVELMANEAEWRLKK